MSLQYEVMITCITVAQIAAAFWLLTSHLPRRPDFGIHVAVSATMLVLVAAILLAVFNRMTVAGAGNLAVTPALVYGSLPLMLVATILCYDVTVLTAFFFATAALAVFRMSTTAASLFLELLMVFVPFGGAPSFVLLLLLILSTVAVYTLCYWSFVRPVRQSGVVNVDNRIIVAMAIVMLLCVVAFDQITSALMMSGISRSITLLTLSVSLVLTFFMLYAEYQLAFRAKLEVELATLSTLMESERRQYEISRDLIDAINVKCHDIRHQIRHFHDGDADVSSDFLADLAREVDIYDSIVKSDSEPLDIILTEKGLVCEQEGITFTCIADGEALSFMAPADVYSLFGNALENAIEAVRVLEDPTKRAIGLDVRTAGEMLLIHVENYFSGELVMEDGMPQTTKADASRHGYGIKSMVNIAERYGGTLATVVRDEVFALNVAIPLASESAVG